MTTTEQPKITKQYIIDNLFREDGYINSWKLKKLKISPEKIFLIFHNLKVSPKCECGKNASFLGFSKGYLEFCSRKCSDNSELNRGKRRRSWASKTKKERGDILNKRKDTCLCKYGKDNSFKVEKFKEKAKQTKLEKYEDENYNNREQYLETCQLLHGVDNLFQLPIVKDKSKQTKLENYGDENYCNAQKIRTTKEINGTIVPLSEKPDFEHYRMLVTRITNSQPLTDLENIDNRGRTPDDFHLDHKYSVFQGFKDNILPYYIGNINNLEMINSIANISKRTKCSISYEELINIV